MSTMLPACGGPAKFDSVSPARILSPPGSKAVAAAAAGLLPPTFLLASAADVIVPWQASALMHEKMHEAGGYSRLLIYPSTGHADIAISFRPRGAGAARPPHEADVLSLALSCAPGREAARALRLQGEEPSPY